MPAIFVISRDVQIVQSLTTDLIVNAAFVCCISKFVISGLPKIMPKISSQTKLKFILKRKKNQ